jgi:glyoxylase-like metal-dependent hydrolase (beta-lactamase superfamily II)
LDIYNLSPASWGSNCYILISDGNDGTRHAAVVDPSADANKIISFIENKNATLDFIVLTHGHFDHVLSLDTLRDKTNAPAYIHEDDDEMLPDGQKNAYSLFFGVEKHWRPAEKLLDDGDMLKLGEDTIKVISTPGHSKGSICLLCEDKLITGDTIFANGYGRYDLHGGDADVLQTSLLSLRSLDEDLTIYPGHGGKSTLKIALDNILYY